MTGLSGKRWFYFIWDDYNEVHLGKHHITSWEAEELFFNTYIITPNRKKYGVKKYRINGRTNAGRKLLIIFEDFGSNTARIITGWSL